jgi:hypothetical protein
MPSIIIHHQSIMRNWLRPELIEKPRALVLGSFNPYFEDGQIVDYFYGRSSNYFWKTIAQIVGEEDENYYLNNFERKLNVMNNRFCCMDVIDSIEFTSNDETKLIDYINSKIKTGFLDQNIFVTKTKFLSEVISLKRNYNDAVIKTLMSSNSIKIVIHTMGNERISHRSTKPKEDGLGINGFGEYIGKIKSICENRNIRFIDQTFSPSEYAVKNKSTSTSEFADFLKEHLSLDN